MGADVSDLEAQVKALNTTEDSLLVILVPGSLSEEEADHLRKDVRAFTDKQVLVLTEGIEIGYLVGLTPNDYRKMAEGMKFIDSRDQRIKELEQRQYRAAAAAQHIVALDQRIKELTVALQDLYDWGAGEIAKPAAKASWDAAYQVLYHAREPVDDTTDAILDQHRDSRTAG